EKCVGVVPDPSTLLLRNADLLWPAGQLIAAHDFRASLADLCPAIDGGTVHKQVLATMIAAGSRPAGRDDHFSPALTFALRYLRDCGVLEYWCPDDQRTFLLL